MPKKTKAIKKTDQRAQKAWLRKVKPSIYAIETKETNKTILIVAEGQSEKLYFESFPVLTLTEEKKSSPTLITPLKVGWLRDIM
jgi:hypothetical protein